MIEFVQLGIDLHGLANIGKHWFSDGGHFTGRKWPILFASIVLDKPELRTFPADLTKRIYGAKVEPSTDVPHPTTFSRKTSRPILAKALGQKALWQIGVHTGAQAPFEEKPWSGRNGMAATNLQQLPSPELHGLDWNGSGCAVDESESHMGTRRFSRLRRSLDATGRNLV